MRGLVCVAFINGLPYEDTACESRNSQQDLSLVSEAHDTDRSTSSESKQERKKGQVKERRMRAEEETDMTTS